MNLLYFSCHAILEYDEIKLFHELGINVFSAGAYSNPQGHPSLPRPSLPQLPYYPELERAASTIRATGGAFPDELIEWADVIVFMHEPDILQKNWPKLKHKRVIFRSIGQCVPHQERLLGTMVAEGLQIVRYSPREDTIPDYAGEAAMIRFYKDPDEYKGWTGEVEKVINFTQSLKQRATSCGYEALMQMTNGVPRVFYGPNNEDLESDWGGLLSYRQQLKAMQNNRAMFYHGTYPASYTLSLIEAMMTGMPIVAVGPQHGNGSMFPNMATYEVQDFIQHGENGFCSDNLDGLNHILKNLIEDHEYAKRIGEVGRVTAINLFGKAKIMREWAEFLGVNK